jgi:serine/threonine protein kinase
MKREIEVQSSMSHRNIMPIVDWDRTHFRWYVMPRGVQSMRDLPTPVESLLLLRIVTQLLDGLEHAHGAGHPHRDVNPANIIEVEDGGDRRWVLADWGLTRRELGKTTSALTKTGVLLGTEGFAPPEAYIDGHSVGEPGDLFSLGQVIAWGLGVMPNPYVRTEVEGPWRDLVYVMTQPALADRVQSVAEAREGLRKVAAQLGVVL